MIFYFSLVAAVLLGFALGLEARTEIDHWLWRRDEQRRRRLREARFLKRPYDQDEHRNRRGWMA